jgi:hypothetical protein
MQGHRSREVVVVQDKGARALTPQTRLEPASELRPLSLLSGALRAARSAICEHTVVSTGCVTHHNTTGSPMSQNLDYGK